MDVRSASWIQLAIAIVFVAASSAASAQERSYIGGGLSVSAWSGRESSQSSPSLRFASSTSGRVPGLALEAGVRVGPLFVVGAELGIPARHQWTQVSGYLFGPFEREIRYRDTTIAALAGVGGQLTESVRVTAVGGIELVQENWLERRADGRLGPVGDIVYGSFGATATLKNWTTGAVFGADLAITASRHFAIVPQVRVHLIARDDVATAVGSLNVAPSVFRAGVVVRAAF